MAGIRWTEEEDNFLIENYEKLEKDKLCNSLYNRSWDAIKIRAEKMKIRRYNNKERFVDLDILLNDKNESYYWIGFIMADGHIYNKSRLKICLSIKDMDHLKLFKKFINYNKELTTKKNNGFENVSISVMDTKYLNILSEKFYIKHNKTYDPCNIQNIENDDLLLSLIIGFIDGDGSIRNQTRRKDCQLSIKCHKNWLNNLNFILNSIIRITGENCETTVKSTKCNRYSYINIANSRTLKSLKCHMLKLKIPYMKRKWDIIDMNFESRYDTKKINKIKMIEIINDNKNIKVKEIAQIMNLSEECIYNYKKQIRVNRIKNS